MIGRKVLNVLLFAGLMLFLYGTANGQAVNNAQIHGSVLDPTGAAIVGAQIEAISKSTGSHQATVSGPDGSFVLPGLPVGGYTLEVAAQGFNKYQQSGIVLKVGQNVQVNVSLKVGSASQVVQASADAAMVETQDTSISEVMDQERIVDLPLGCSLLMAKLQAMHSLT